MKQDLEAINAALRLGDPALPPAGSVCRFVTGLADTSWCFRVLHHFKSTDRKCVAATRVGESRRDCEVGYFHLEMGQPFQVVELPEHAPHFEEWERWGSPMSKLSTRR